VDCGIGVSGKVKKDSMKMEAVVVTVTKGIFDFKIMAAQTNINNFCA